jgi:predicted nucleotidyltransferase
VLRLGAQIREELLSEPVSDGPDGGKVLGFTLDLRRRRDLAEMGPGSSAGGRRARVADLRARLDELGYLERVSTAVAGSPRVKAIGEVLAAFPEVRLALLFGSEAKGTARRDSDVDVAVEAPVGSLGQLAAALSSRVGSEVDVVRLETASIPLLEALIAEGIVVHEGKRGAGALWRSRVLAQLETDRPWYRRQRDAWLQRVAEHGFSRG